MPRIEYSLQRLGDETEEGQSPSSKDAQQALNQSLRHYLMEEMKEANKLHEQVCQDLRIIHEMQENNRELARQNEELRKQLKHAKEEGDHHFKSFQEATEMWLSADQRAVYAENELLLHVIYSIGLVLNSMADSLT